MFELTWKKNWKIEIIKILNFINKEIVRFIVTIDKDNSDVLSSLPFRAISILEETERNRMDHRRSKVTKWRGENDQEVRKTRRRNRWGQGCRARGRVRSWRDPRADLAAAADKTIAVPLVFCERAFRGQVCALHEESSGRARVAPGFEKSSPVSRLASSCLPLCAFCLPCLIPLAVSSSRVFARGMVSIRLSCWTDSCTCLSRPWEWHFRTNSIGERIAEKKERKTITVWPRFYRGLI